MELDNINISDTLLVINKLNSKPTNIYVFKTPKQVYLNKLSNKEKVTFIT